jgi:Holliday junction resolvasome RuvABC endonuclease subunit
MSSVNRKIFYGIDPGSASGAWGAVDDTGAFVGCGDLPVKDGRILALELRDILLAPEHIAIEDVHTMPGQGIASSGKFMRAAGAIEAVAALTGAQVTLVRPQVWKKHHDLIGTEKVASLELARALWPDAPLKLAKHHGRADALLMALWGLCN